MPFATFKSLVAEAKGIKLNYAFGKINNKFSQSKWIFKCCQNMKYVTEIYYNMLDMVINTCCFLKFIFEEIEDIETMPVCRKHNPSIHGLDYMVTDIQLLLDLVLKALDSRVFYDHPKFNIMFELAHSLYDLLKSFQTRYVSRTYNKI